MLKIVTHNCDGLWRTAKTFINKKFIPLCDGLDGELGDLKVSSDYQSKAVKIPIDTIINNLDGIGDDKDDSDELVEILEEEEDNTEE